MFSKLSVALLFMALCVVVHASGVAWALRFSRRRSAPSQSFWRFTWLFIQVAAWMILIHLFEITLWGVLYATRDAMPDLPSALYFSAVTYTTTGYGDLVLPAEWRLVGGVEALTGILMCGWSTGFFFAVVNRAYEAQKESAPIRPIA